jgi:hypothetical protein
MRLWLLLGVFWAGLAQAQPMPDVASPPPQALLAAPGFAIIPDPRFIWHGPAEARGLFVWGHGFGGKTKDRRGIAPPPFLRAFNKAGWDIARYDRAPRDDADVPRVVAWLHESLVSLRATGWRRIGAGGQSRGGWNALEMLRFPGTADVIITASAGPGTGKNPVTQATKGQGMLRDLTAEVPPQPTRLAYVQFRDDPYGGDKDQRAARIRETLPQKLGAVTLIDQPDGFKGHGAAETAAFGQRYGACLLRFAEDTPPGHC